MSRLPRAAQARALGLPESHESVRIYAAVMVAGGLALALDVFPRAAAAILAASLVPTTIIGHAFWTEQSPAALQAQQVHFLKNLATLAALLLIVVEPRERQHTPA